MENHNNIWRQTERWKRKKLIITFFIFCGLVGHMEGFLKGFAANGQEFKPAEERPSQSSITAIKGASVWLYWDYTNFKSGAQFEALATNFKEQVIGLKTSSQQNVKMVAKRIGQTGALSLEPSIPAQFSGRVEVISSNSTLVIRSLQYNDSMYQFVSNLILESRSGSAISPKTIALKPNFKLAVLGIPDFAKHPPTTLNVNENEALELKIEMDGNPEPSVEFKWSHLPISSSKTVPSIVMYPYLHSSTYVLKNVDGSYCGRTLQTTLKNSQGTSSVKNTQVFVFLKLTQNLEIQARKLPNDGCVEVKWTKVDAGACHVKYDVAFKNSSGSYLYNVTGYNIEEVKRCNLTVYNYITDVELTVSVNNASRTFTTKLVEAIAQPPSSTSDSNGDIGVIIGDSLRWLVLLVVVIVFVSYYLKTISSQRMKIDSTGNDAQLECNHEDESNMEHCTSFEMVKSEHYLESKQALHISSASQGTNPDPSFSS